MKILSIDTTSNSCSAALMIDEQIIERFEVCPREQSKNILKYCQSLLSEAQLTLSQLDGIAVTHGPGSFTGVRLGLSVAQGLAFGAHLPMVTVSTLQTLALAELSLSRHQPQAILVAMDARRDEVYYAGYQVQDKKLIEIIPEQVIAPQDIAPLDQDLFTKRVVACGEGFGAYKEALLARIELSFMHIDEEALPHAKYVAILAKEKFEKGEGMNPVDCQPIYLRNDVVST